MCVVRVLKKKKKKKKAQQIKNLDSVLFAYFRTQHELKTSHFDIECPLLADGSYK